MNRGTLAGLARALAGALVGTAAGLVVSLGIVVYQAQFANRFIESTNDLLSWKALPLPAGLVAGAIAGWAAPRLLARGSLGALAGGLAGALLGGVIGALVSTHRSGPWAGGVIGAALGILLGVAVAVSMARRRRPGPRLGDAASAAALSLGLLCAGALLSCGGEPPPLPDVPPAPAPEAEPVESVILLFGDPGKAGYLHYPILPQLAHEVESWAARLERDSSVVVVVLGDVIYPDGMHEPGTEGYWTDSARVASHIDVVRGPAGQRRGARMYFVAGNHDWGLMEDREGARRLRNLGSFLDRVRARGPFAELVPEAGTGMPHVVDLGGIRLILLDTAWWIFDAEPERKFELIERLAAAVAGAGEREVVIAAHHPYQTAGPHGGEVTVWKLLGIRRLLARSGAMLQSMDSRPYRALQAALQEIFTEAGRPLVFAGGHEHSLQVIRHDTATAPQYTLVSGSASKLTGVGWAPGMLYRRSAPGYMRLVTRESGAVDLYVLAAPERYLACPENEPDELEWEACLIEGVAAYETVFSMRLKAASGDVPAPAAAAP